MIELNELEDGMESKTFETIKTVLGYGRDITLCYRNKEEADKVVEAVRKYSNETLRPSGVPFDLRIFYLPEHLLTYRNLTEGSILFRTYLKREKREEQLILVVDEKRLGKLDVALISRMNEMTQIVTS